jgi:hypothetical protein
MIRSLASNQRVGSSNLSGRAICPGSEPGMANMSNLGRKNLCREDVARPTWPMSDVTWTEQRFLSNFATSGSTNPRIATENQ